MRSGAVEVIGGDGPRARIAITLLTPAAQHGRDAQRERRHEEGHGSHGGHCTARIGWLR